MDIDGEGRIYQNGTNYQYDYYLKDHLGSTRMVVNDQNQITEAIAYQPYGTIVPLDNIASSPQTLTRQQFTGKEFDREGAGIGISGMKLYYFGKRYYDPELGVWLSTDPKDQLFNPYGYSTNPIMTIDPDGQYILGALIGGAIGFAAGGLIGGAINDKGWSWGGAFQGMMIGASLGSGIENAIGVKSFGLGTSAPPSRFPNTAYGRGLMVASSKSIGTFGTLADASGLYAETHVYLNSSGQATNMTYTANNDPNVYVHQGGQVISKGLEPPQSSWFYAMKGSQYQLVADGYNWVGNSWGSEIAWRTQFADKIRGAMHWKSGGFSDFKLTHPNEFGNAWGHIMTSRDVGNAMWGSHVARNYWYVSPNGLQTISNRVAGGIEHPRSWGMQIWGYNYQVTF